MRKKTPAEYRRELEGKRNLFHTERWIQAKAEEYERQYYADLQADAERYLDSELVQRAGALAGDHFIGNVILKAPHDSDKEQVSCSLYLQVTDSSIVFYDPSKKMPAHVGMRMEQTDPGLWRELNLRFYQDHRREIKYTKDGWRFESITDPDKLQAVALAIAMTAEDRVQRAISSPEKVFPDDGNACLRRGECRMPGSSCEITLTYTAENLRFVPARRI